MIYFVLGHLLPSDTADMFQFCYLSNKCVVSASTPFTFESNDMVAVEDPADPGLLVFKSRVSQLKDQLHKVIIYIYNKHCLNKYYPI